MPIRLTWIARVSFSERARVAVAAHQLGSGRDAGAGDHDARGPERLAHRCHGGFVTGRVDHVAYRSRATDFGRNLLRQLLIHVEDADLGPGGRERARRRLAEPGGAAGHDRRLPADVHALLLR